MCICTWSLMVFLLANGCTVYHNQPVSMEAALRCGGPAKIVTTSNQVVELYDVLPACSPPGYFGGTREKGKPGCFQLDTTKIRDIYVEDPVASRKRTTIAIIATVLPGAGIVIIAVLANEDFGKITLGP